MLKIKNLEKNFGDKKIFNNLNFEMEKGEVFALIGPNGVGKTTLMRMILGWDKEYTGKIEKSENIKISYSPEIPEFPKILKGVETLEYFMEIRGISKRERKIEAEYLLKKVGIPLEKDTLVKNYSKGMKQRLAVAQSLIGNPDILLLDEPSAGLDFFGQQKIQELIYGLKKEGKTILLNSHLLYDVEKVCDKGIIIMNENINRKFKKAEFEEISLADMFLETAKEVD